MAGRVFITGDIHGQRRVQRLGLHDFPVGAQLDKDDYLIICGDFGLVWADNSEHRYWLRWLEKRPFTTLFVDGNHENFDILNAMPAEEWNGGLVHRIGPSVLHLMRGQVYGIAGATYFTMGGATSVDIPVRKPGITWWPGEMPSQQEYATALESLDTCGWQVDYVLTHCCSSATQKRVNATFQNDDLTHFLTDVEKRLAFKHWFFGHYHFDRNITDKHHCVFESIYEILPGGTLECIRAYTPKQR